MITHIENHNGHVWLLKGRQVRASRTTVTLKGVEIECEYEVSGAFLSATDIDDACSPTARVLGAQIGGVDCLPILDASELEAAIERSFERQS